MSSQSSSFVANHAFRARGNGVQLASICIELGRYFTFTTGFFMAFWDAIPSTVARVLCSLFTQVADSVAGVDSKV